MYNVFSVPLIVAPVQESGGVPTRSTHTPETRPSNLGGTGFNDLEASVFRKLQEVILYEFITVTFVKKDLHWCRFTFLMV